jgi:hypothetical protein
MGHFVPQVLQRRSEEARNVGFIKRLMQELRLGEQLSFLRAYPLCYPIQLFIHKKCGFWPPMAVPLSRFRVRSITA